MQHEKDIIGTDKKKYTIIVYLNSNPEYSLWKTIVTNDMGYESTYKPTPSEILEAKIELWEKIKPC